MFKPLRVDVILSYQSFDFTLADGRRWDTQALATSKPRH